MCFEMRAFSVDLGATWNEEKKQKEKQITYVAHFNLFHLTNQSNKYIADKLNNLRDDGV